MKKKFGFLIEVDEHGFPVLSENSADHNHNASDYVAAVRGHAQARINFYARNEGTAQRLINKLTERYPDIFNISGIFEY